MYWHHDGDAGISYDKDGSWARQILSSQKTFCWLSVVHIFIFSADRFNQY